MILKSFIDLIARLGQSLAEAGWHTGAVRFVSTLAILLCVVLFAWGLYWLTRAILSRVLRMVSSRYKNKVGELLLRRHVVRYTSYLVLCLIFNAAVPAIFEEFPAWIGPLRKLLVAGILFFLVRVITGILWCMVDYQSEYGQNRQRSFKGVVQFATIILYFLGGIVFLSILLDKSPLVFIGGLGAASAVLMLIFKDSILGLVAGAQLSYNDIVRIGDWITMSKFGADGTVIDITLTTVKVRNFDLTITTIPAYNLISDSVQNWRSMSDSGHRRIQRALNIDVTTIRFCTPDFFEALGKARALEAFIKPYLATVNAGQAKSEGEDSRKPFGGLTNVFLFRRYVEFYLRHHPQIETDPKYTLMVRQLAMSDYGLPIQVYCFTRTSVWVSYESVQADVFDHLLAMAPVFGLAVFERTAQTDLRSQGVLPLIGKPDGD